MIFIVVKHPVRPEYAEDWISLVAPFTEGTRAEEGNISFDWFRSTEDRNMYVLVEAFRDAAAGKAYVESAHFKDAIAQLPTWLAAVPEIVHVETPDEGWSRMSRSRSRPEG